MTRRRSPDGYLSPEDLKIIENLVTDICGAASLRDPVRAEAIAVAAIELYQRGDLGLDEIRRRLSRL